jgi:MYXO-CTERM domain-containing protein
VQFLAPPTANAAFFDFYFLSAEYPEFVGTVYNDAFEANITGSAFTGNAALDSLGNLVSVNSAVFTVTAQADLQGTGFDNGMGGGTGWLTMVVPVDPGDTVTFEFTIYDVSDGIYDSSVLLDNFEWTEEDFDTPVILVPIFIDYLSPKRGGTSGGSSTSIYGEGFNSSCTSYFDGIEALSTTYLSQNELLAQIPPHAVGLIDVRVDCAGSDDVLVGGFTYYEDNTGSTPPEIVTVTPYQVIGGEDITVTGINFEEGSQLMVGSEPVDVEFVSDIELHFTAPSHEAGFADVTILNTDGLMDNYAGALYYLPYEEEREEESGGDGSSDGGGDGSELDGEEPKDPDIAVSCSHAPSDSRFWLLAGLLGLAARRRR